VQAITLFFISEGMSNSPDIWNAVNGLNQQGYEGALGATSTHQTQPGSYSSLQPTHSHLVSLPSPAWMLTLKSFLTPVVLTVCLPTVQDFSPHSVVAADMNRSLPPMSTFHRNNTVSHIASVNTSENSTGEDTWKKTTFFFASLI